MFNNNVSRIKKLFRQSNKLVRQSYLAAYDTGVLLAKEKALIPPEKWEAWLRVNFNMSVKDAQVYIEMSKTEPLGSSEREFISMHETIANGVKANG